MKQTLTIIALAGEWQGPVPDWDSYPSRELRAVYRDRQKC